MVGSRRPSGLVVEHGLPVALPHVVLACINPDRVVHDAVENRVGDGVAAELSVPFLGRQLSGERRADGVVSELHELQGESFEWFVGLVDEPFVDREQVVGGVFAHELGRSSWLVRRDRHLLGQVRHSDVDRAVPCPARGFRQRA